MSGELAPDEAWLKSRYLRLLQLAGFLQEDAFRLFCLMGRLSPRASAPLLEVGVFCGRSLVGLALAFPHALALGVDPMFEDFDNEYALEGEGAFLAEAANYASSARRLADFEELLRELEADGETGLASRVRIERMTQAQFLASNKAGPTYQLVHLDGEHTYAAVQEALDHLPSLLLPGAWLVMDDYSNPGFPEIAEAIHRHESFRKELLPVAYGFNKGIFLWRAEMMRFQTVLELMERSWRAADFLVRPLADRSLVIQPKVSPAPAVATRTLRYRAAQKLRRLAGILEG